MSNKNKKVVTMDAKVENQEKTAPVTPETPVEPEGTSATGEETGDEKEEKKKFELPKIKLPKIPLPSKETVIRWLKTIGLFLLGALAGAVAIVGAAQKIVSSQEKDDEPEDETEDEIEEQEDDIPDEPEEDPADEATEG